MADGELNLQLKVAHPDEIRVPIVKAHFIGRDGTEVSNVGDVSQSVRQAFIGSGAIEPPFDTNELTMLLEMSGSLRTSVDAYAINIDGLGHDFEPVIDLDDPDTNEVIRQALFEERIRENLLGGGEDIQAATKSLMDRITRVQRIVKGELLAEDDTSPEGESELDSLGIEVTEAEIEDKIEELRRSMVWERKRAESFFDWCCVDKSFQKLRVITRHDIETLGNGYWEILRNADGTPVQLTYVAGFTVRLMPLEEDPVQIQVEIPRTLLRADIETINHRFRKYLQVNVNGGKKIFFKEWGDERVMSAQTGRYYKDVKDLERKESDGKPATELMHFKVHSPRTPYGVPRWISELLAVLGNRHAEEINLAYFENKSIPPMVIMISGGKLGEGEVERIKNFMHNEIRGKRNFHKIMVIQAESTGANLSGQNSGTVKIEIKPLTQHMQQDGLFMDYQEKNGDRIGGVFRLPRLLRGDVRDFNRATAEASLKFTEEQVFSPLRRDFDWQMNRFLLPALGVRLWKFVSKGPETADTAELGKMLNESIEAGYPSMKEARELAERVHGRKFASPDQDDETRELSNIPIKFLELGLRGTDADNLDDGKGLPEDPAQDTPEQTRKRTLRRRLKAQAVSLLALKSKISAEATRAAHEDFTSAHDPDINMDHP